MTNPSDHLNIPRASKSLLKEVRMLQQAKFRKERGEFVAEGIKVVEELLSSGIRVMSVIGEPDAVSAISRKFTGDVFFQCSKSDLEYCSGLKTPNQVIAVGKIPAMEPFGEVPVSEPVLILDGLADPGNMGTIIRTAEWFGIKTIYCSPDCVDCWSPKVVQSAMGSLFRSRVIYADLLKVMNMFLESGRHSVVAATLDGEEKTPGPQSLFALVIGSESHGIRQQLLNLIPSKVMIPKSQGVPTESLNAAVATGILLYSLAKK